MEVAASAPAARHGALLHALIDAIGADHVLVGEAAAARARHVWDPRPLEALAVLRPADTAEVSAVLQACHAARVPVVTHGGGTGLAGGGDSDSGQIVLSLERLRAIESLNAGERTITVQAGCVLETVQAAADRAGFRLGIDLGARGSCTIGGNIATNAGGLSVLRFGMTRQQVLGLEAVLADGTVVSSMKGLVKDNTGYDWTQLMIGSEGTLGVVTRAVLRLHPATPVVSTAMLGLSRFADVTALLGALQRDLDGTLDAFEVIWNPFYRLNTDPAHADHTPAPLGRDHALYVIAESRGSDSRARERFDAALAAAFERGGIEDAVVAQSETERRRLWPVREHIEIALRHDPLFVYDVSLPVAAMPSWLDTVEAELRAAWPELHFYAYGHLADGNLHVLAAPGPIRDGARVRHGLGDASAVTLEREAFCDRVVYGALRDIGGSVSAEHGIGTKKRRWLAASRSPAELALMRAIKRALDPTGVLNPGKILPDDDS